MKEQIVKFAAIAAGVDHSTSGQTDLGQRQMDSSRWLSPLAVLAIEGNAAALDRYVDEFTQMASANWGVQANGIRNRLDDSFMMRSAAESYHGLIARGLIDDDTQQTIAPWLYQFALAAVDGRVASRPDFEHWHLRNQNVPATCVYNIAHLLDDTMPGRFDTQPLWQWGDEQLVGWDLTWRDPDDSYLYQFIWTWSAYLHAKYRNPDLLQSENARRSLDFYKHLDCHGLGVDLLFGDSKPGDLLGPAVSLLLSANLFNDGEALALAARKIELAVERGICENIFDRGPEMYRLYTLWPDDLQPVEPVRESRYIASPLGGHGWTLMESPYAQRIKTTDERYPHMGKTTTCCDEIYQQQDAEAYAIDKPDKIVLCEGDQSAEQTLYALADLRSHGLHDHADALGVTTLIDLGVSWLIESPYLPRGTTNQRWQHNVPLWRAGQLDGEQLLHWESDNWAEVQPGDVTFRRQPNRVTSSAWLRHDAFDFADLVGNQFDVQRLFVLLPNEGLIVVDRLIAQCEGPMTFGQVWHTTADAQFDHTDMTWQLSRDGKHYHAAFTTDTACHVVEQQREATQKDPYYYPPDRLITDLLLWRNADVSPGDAFIQAACFGRLPTQLHISDLSAAGVLLTAWGRQLQLSFDSDEIVASGSKRRDAALS